MIVSLTSTPDFEQLVNLVFEKTRMIQARGEDIAIAAAMKRYEKEKDEKASANRGTTPSGRGGRRGRNSSRGGNSNANARHSKNPNNANYKGDSSLRHFRRTRFPIWIDGSSITGH